MLVSRWPTAAFLCALFVSVASAPAPAAQDTPPCGAGIRQSEIALQFRGTGGTLRIYNSAGTLLTPADSDGLSVVGGAVSIPVAKSASDCSAYVSFGNDGLNTDAAAIRYPNGPYPFYTVRLSAGGSEAMYVYSDGDQSWCSSAPGVQPRSFLCPIQPQGSSSQNADFFLGYQSGAFRVSPNWMWPNPSTGKPANFIDETISGDDWVWPYHKTVVCAGGRCKAATPGTRGKILILPVDQVYSLGSSLTKRISETITLASAGEYNWSEGGLTLAFDHGEQLVVQSQDFSAGPLTLTSSTPNGWGGIRFESGSDGDLSGTPSDRLVISDVSGTQPAVYVQNANVSLDYVRMVGRFQQPSDYDLEVAAVWATGTSANVGITNSIIEPHSSTGIVAAAGADVYVSDTDL